MALGGEYIMLQGDDLDEQTLILEDSVVTNEDFVLNSQFDAELYSVLLCNTRETIDTSQMVNSELSWTAGDAPWTKDSNVQGVHEFSTDDQRAVTHIEIIKSSGCRRVSGANRVVPFLTNTLKTGKTNAGSEMTLAEHYRTFLQDGSNSDNNRTCEICGLECISCAQLEHHLKSCHKMTEVTSEQCFVCRKKYIFKSQLCSHLSIIHGIQTPELICKTCFMEFNTTSEQKAHERKHDHMYPCQICGEKFLSQYLCQEHLKKHSLHPEPTECSNCGKKFKSNALLEIHKRRHLRLKCNVCGYESSDELHTLIHLKTHNSEDRESFLNIVAEEDKNESHLEKLLAVYLKQSSKSKCDRFENRESKTSSAVKDCLNSMVSTVSLVNKGGVESGVECKICNITVSSGKELLDHRQKFHLRNRRCPFCGKRNQSVSQTWRHMKAHLAREKNIAADSLLPQCAQRDAWSSAASNGMTKSRKPRAGTFNCTVCHKKLSTSDIHAASAQQHSGDKSSIWKCAECELASSQPRLLLKRPSSQEAEMKCLCCFKSFQSHRMLEEHLKTHSCVKEKKIFKCNWCDVRCLNLSGLVVHQRCHTGERPYSCGQCQRSFKRLQGVKKHIQVVHDSANLEYHLCTKCPKRFNSVGNLMRHYLRVHRHVRRYICGICGCRFSQNQDLQKHFKISHKMEVPNIPYADRKALEEIYVIPGVDHLPVTNAHAAKIRQIVAEEKAKFKGVAELLKNKSIKQKGSNVQVQRKQRTEVLEEPDLLPLCIMPVSENNVFYIDTNGSEGVSNEINDGDVGDATYTGKINLPSIRNNCEVNLYSCQHCCKVFVGESLFVEHFQERSELICKKCNENFCSEALLEEHTTSHHALFHCHICRELFVGKELLVNHLLNVEGIAVLEDMQGGTVDVQKEVQTIISEAQASALMSPMGGTGLSNAITDVSNGNESCVVSDMDGDNILYNNPCNQFSGPLNINGILLPNVILQSNPTIIQSLPLTIPNGDLINSMNSSAHVINMGTTSNEIIQQSHAVYAQTSDFVANNVSELHESLRGNSSNVETEQYAILTRQEEGAAEYEQIGTDEDGKVMSSGAADIGGENVNELSAQEEVVDVRESTDNSKNVCKVCGERFGNLSALSRHRKSHTAGCKPFGCAQCGKHFSEKHNLKMHLMIHSGERPYKCEECGKQLRYRKDVTDHKRMHSGEKQFGCEECGRKFMRQRELIRHKVIHTGDKKYKCPVCGKAFGRLDQLKHAHLPTHDSEHVHTCQICEKGFTLKSKLKRHELLHTGLKKYHCHLCQKSFVLEPYLKTHLQSHKKRDSYLPCPKCPRRFATEATLQVHEKSIHGRVHKSGERAEPIRQRPSKKAFAGDEIQDVDLCSILEGDNCDAVIYLQMGAS